MTPLRRTVHVETRRGIVAAEYRPGDITLADIEDGDAEGDPIGVARRLIVSCVASWTIADRDGARFPITAAGVRRLDVKLVYDLANAIVLDMRAMLIAEQARAKP